MTNCFCKNGDYIEVMFNGQGPLIRLKGKSNKAYHVAIIDTDISEYIYGVWLKPGMYAQCVYGKPVNLQIILRDINQEFETCLFMDSGVKYRGHKEFNSDLFSHYKKFDRILVMGPARSGSTIMAKMIANDTGHYFADESEIGWKCPQMLNFLCDRKKKFVLQGNLLLFWPQIIKNTFDKVIIPVRDIKDIWKSMRKLNNVDFNVNGFFDEVFEFDDDLPSAIYKYIEVCDYDADYIKYKELENHPMFVKDRKAGEWGKPYNYIEEYRLHELE